MKNRQNWNIDIEAPANGRIHRATVTVRDDNGNIRFTDKADMTAIHERRKLGNRLAERLQACPEEVAQHVEAGWAETLNAREKQQQETQAGAAGALSEVAVEVLDGAPDVIRRPLALLGGRAYAAAWLNVQTRTTRAVDPQTGAVRVYDPPLIQTVPALAIIRNDGVMYSDLVPGARPLGELGLEVALPNPVPSDRGWSGAGVKRFAQGERSDPADVFHRVKTVVNTFMDFARSLDSQDAMCEMIACYVLGTYFLEAFNVVGYLWPNGEKGAGKTNLLVVITELAYLGQVILAGGTYASLRDLADYGATLAFDDAEGVMDARKADPDKRALLLAGNRRGATIPVKEPAGERGWVIRHINAFCNRLFSAIRLPDDVLGSRTLIVPLVRSNDEFRAKQSPLDPVVWPCERRRLVDDLWAMGLQHLPQMRDCDVRAATKARLSGRDLEPWRSILAVALWLEEKHQAAGLYGRMEQLSVDYQSERSNLESNDPIRLLIKALEGMLTTECRFAVPAVCAVMFETSALTNAMNQLAREEELVEDGKGFTNSRRVGRLLDRLRFKRAPRTARAKRWQVDKALLVGLARSYGMTLCDASEPPQPNGTNGRNGIMAQPEQTGTDDSLRGDAWEGE